ncbi:MULTISPECIES: sugar kinase [Niallia]|uniref:Sugar kinase n=1 Tax=Niallia alba TaxID=2729105 RepID=A0A7Y0KBB3_9BACI|nr:MULTISPECIES: sugar kinase [Niallia]MBQ6446911.1 sugar kinase [Bacillus sp. (in: firmicutes)]NMO78988.1 sugar kinase [Niallia alba]UTI42314.1 sugar kinase [Niallia sp. RD1]
MGKVVTLGEIMLRLSTDSGIRIAQAENLHAHYGGGEANVAISLANFGHDVYFASKIPDNGVGEGVKKHLSRYGVHTDFLLSGGSRLGTYYMEAGIGERAANVIYDRAGSSFAEIAESEWQKEELFKNVDIFHISGITPALSSNWKKTTITLIKAAKEAGCKISFDINYRGKLWSQKEAGETITEILPLVDYCSAGKLDAIYLLGIPEYTGDDNELVYYYQEIQKKFPNIAILYSTKRKVLSASSNELIGTLWMNDSYYESQIHLINPIVDRVGGGDALAGGILHGILVQNTPQEIINFASAASALKHTIYGDCNQFSEPEVKSFLLAGSGKINR